MPGLNSDDSQNDDLFDDDDPEAPDTGSDDAGDDDAGSGGSDDAGKQGNVDKRVSDLQSKLDKEIARANKAEKALKARGEGNGQGNDDPRTAALMQELREASLDSVYAEFSELKQYGIDRSLIEGSTRTELRQSATTLVGLIKSVKTKVRNEVLAEVGVKADPAGARREPPKDYGKMSDEEFEKLLNSM